jgi:hypothetical protein
MTNAQQVMTALGCQKKREIRIRCPATTQTSQNALTILFLIRITYFKVLQWINVAVNIELTLNTSLFGHCRTPGTLQGGVDTCQSQNPYFPLSLAA